MSSISRRRAVLIGLGGISLASAGFLAPGAYAANTIDGDVKVSNTETVQVQMNAEGKIDAQRVYEQLVLSGNGKVDIANPVSTDKLRNLDGFGGFDIRDGEARVKTDVDGTKKYRSVSNFTKRLPLDINITYTFNGKEVDPGDIVGKSGDLEVRYVVTNTTGTSQDVSFEDGSGTEQTAAEDVVIPMVGTLTTVLPSTFTKVVTDGANGAGDGRGGTQLSYTMTLIPPIGKATAEFGYKAKVRDAVIPKANVSALPVNPLENRSFKGGAESYKGGAQTGQDLTAGATEIDTNLLKIRDGASELVAGILQLSDGADQLSAGLNDEAAPGAKKLADGAGQLDAGAKKLKAGTGDLTSGANRLASGASDLYEGTGKLDAGASKLDQGAGSLSTGLEDADAGAGALADGAAKTNAGAGQLADGLRSAGAQAPDLLGGIDQIAAGLEAVSAGLTTLNGQVVPGANSINTGATNLIAALNGQLIPGLSNAESALANALALANSLDDALPQKNNLVALISGAKTGVGNIKTGLAAQVVPGVTQIQGGSKAIADGVDGATGANGSLKQGVGGLQVGVAKLKAGGLALVDGLGALSSGADDLAAGTDQVATGANGLKAGTGQLSAGAKSLKAGTGDLKAGAGDLEAGAGKLKAGTGELKSGAGRLNAGAGDLSAGTGKISAGAGTLSTGLGTAAAGSIKLAAGLAKAAESAPALPEGATKLSKEGTSQIVGKGNATAMDFGLRYALLEAGAARAATAQPYGSPEGATALTAYKFEIAGENGASSANLKRGLAAVALLVAAGAFATVRRRGLI